MASFKPFDNDSQVVTFSTEDEELSMENGREQIVLSGCAVFTKGDAQSKQTLLQLQQQLQAVLLAMD